MIRQNFMRLCGSWQCTTTSRGMASTNGHNPENNDNNDNNSGVEKDSPNMPGGISEEAQRVVDATKKKFHDTKTMADKLVDKAEEAADKLKAKARHVKEKAHDVKEKITGHD